MKGPTDMPSFNAHANGPSLILGDSPAIALRQLVVEIGGRRLLDIPALTLRHGEHVALIGPNGAGKSTLLKVVGGFLPITRGRVNVLGRAFGDKAHLTARQWRALRAEVGQVMQGLHLVPRLSALDNTILGALARPGAMPRWRSWLRLYPPALQAEARVALAALGLGTSFESRADHLSGGERQKVSLARLRMQRPRLVLADEPTAALDPSATRIACGALRDVAQGATLLSVVHDAALLPLLAERVIALKDGQILFDLPLKDLKPAHLDTLYADANCREAASPRPHRSPVSAQGALRA